MGLTLMEKKMIKLMGTRQYDGDCYIGKEEIKLRNKMQIGRFESGGIAEGSGKYQDEKAQLERAR